MKNPVQFQKCLGLLEFLGQYSDEEKCRDALFRLLLSAEQIRA